MDNHVIGTGNKGKASQSGVADLLVRDAECLVCTPGEEIAGGWVAVKGGFVSATGRVGEEPEASEVLDATGCLVTPGLINTHHHIFQNLTRSFAPVVNADDNTWWRTLSGLWAGLDEEAAYVSTWIGLAELALGGCTATSDDMYIHPQPRLVDASIAAAREVGLRFHPVRGGMDAISEQSEGLPGTNFQDADDILEDGARLVSAYHDRSGGAMVRIALSATSPLGCSPGLFKSLAELAERLDVQLHTHLGEPRENEHVLALHGKRSVDLLEETGWGSSRAWVAHCVDVNDDEVARLGSWGTGVSHCPSSVMLLFPGHFAPIAELRAAGAPVGLGCDGSSSTDHASLWLEARTALLVGKHRKGPEGMSARDVLEMATTGSAACLGRGGELGVLTPGACGDLVAWPLEGIPFAGAWTDPVEAWLRCGPISARHTVVAGKVLVRDGEFTVPGSDEMLRRHREITRSWQGLAQ